MITYTMAFTTNMAMYVNIVFDTGVFMTVDSTVSRLQACIMHGELSQETPSPESEKVNFIQQEA